MPKNWIPVTYDRFASSSLRPHSSFAFARKDSIVPIVLAEVDRVAATYPIAFIRTDKLTVPVAVLALDGADNLFITAEGKWFGPYVPAVLRGYPFALANDPAGQPILCYDQSSGLVAEGNDGEALFAAGKTPSDKLREVMLFLRELHEGRQKTSAACAELERLALFDDLRFGDNNGKVRHIEGLLQINLSRLNEISDADFVSLRRLGGLPLVYAHAVSLGHWPAILRLSEMQAQTKVRTNSPPASLDGLFGMQQDELNIDWSKLR